MDVNDNAGHLKPRGALEFIASKLAPTRCPVSSRLYSFIGVSPVASFVIHEFTYA